MVRRLLLAFLVIGPGLPVARADDPEPPPKVVKTASGLKYENLKEGKGKAVKKNDKVEVHYTLWLAANKKQVDSTADRRQTFSFNVSKGEVIKGFDEGVVGMQVGGKRKLTVPSKLGYGAKGAGEVIPPDADLIFEVELLAIK
jgi:FKBP-type peptidyl-prolyl cis-trans isomerase FkpA